MNRTEYMRVLEKRLGSLDSDEREEALQYYRDHFQEALAMGETEEEICKKLGDPDKIARFILAEYSVDNLDEKRPGRSIMSAIVSIIGLGFFNLVVSLPFFIVLYALVLSLYVIAVAFMVSPFLMIFFPWTVTVPMVSGLSLILFGAGLFFIGLYIFMKSGKIWGGVAKITIKFLKWNLNVIRRG